MGIVRVANGPQSQFYINALEEGGVVSEVAACLLLDCSIALLVLYLSTTVKFSAFLPFLGSWGSRFLNYLCIQEKGCVFKKKVSPCPC